MGFLQSFKILDEFKNLHFLKRLKIFKKNQMFKKTFPVSSSTTICRFTLVAEGSCKTSVLLVLEIERVCQTYSKALEEDLPTTQPNLQSFSE